MLTHWMSLQGKSDVPNHNLIDPLAYPTDSLPFISIVELEPATKKYKARLVGSAVCDAFGINPTGQYITEAAYINKNATKRLDWCVSHRTHYLTSDKYTKGDLIPKGFTSITMPYKNENGDISRILSAFMFTS